MPFDQKSAIILTTDRTVEFPVIEAEGQRVVTLAMIDQIHGRPEGTARRNFNENRNRFTQGEDYFVRNSSEAENIGVMAPRGLTLLTESGYLLLVKSFTDDLSWAIQKQLVATYFRAKATAGAIPSLNDPAALRAALLGYTERVIALEATVQAQAPKVQFHDAVTEATNCQSVQEVAKILGMGPNRFFKILRDEGLLMRNNLPYQEHVDAGRFRVVERQYTDAVGESHTYSRTLVTGRGLAYIQRRLDAPCGLAEGAQRAATTCQSRPEQCA
jgi:phage antirepressor YoqD-like protein